MEVWENIKGFEGYYQVSNKGNVKSLIGWSGNRYVKREKILKPRITKKGYLEVDLIVKRKGIRKIAKIHRLVAEAFILNPFNKLQVNHIDGNKRNNVLENLEWCTNSENQIHAYQNNLQKNHENHPKSKLTLEKAREIRKRVVVGEKSTGNSMAALAKEFGVSNNTIKQIITNKTYKEYKNN